MYVCVWVCSGGQWGGKDFCSLSFQCPFQVCRHIEDGRRLKKHPGEILSEIYETVAPAMAMAHIARLAYQAKKNPWPICAIRKKKDVNIWGQWWWRWWRWWWWWWWWWSWWWWWWWSWWWWSWWWWRWWRPRTDVWWWLMKTIIFKKTDNSWVMMGIGRVCGHDFFFPWIRFGTTLKR